MNAPSRFLTRLIVLRLFALLCVLIGAANPAVAAKTYSDNSDGTVTDPTTGLTWMRCAMGQTWTGGTCTGTASTYTLAQVNALTGTVSFAGQSDWRLPTVRELQTIVERSRNLPAIDSSIFLAPYFYFWSGSPYAYGSDHAWVVYFNSGYDSSNVAGLHYSVRLVRGGQSFGSLLNTARPTTDYIDHGNGTVTHTPTGLMWQRCAKGQTWSGSTCSGNATTYAWDAAAALTDSFAGYTDWRLPTEDELLTLVDYTTYRPSINSNIFPSTPSSYFWSGSLVAGSSGLAWYVYLYDGRASYDYRSLTYSARLVRVGQSLSSFALTVGITGNGSVSSTPSSIACSSTCSAFFTTGSSVTLTATPDTGSTFTGWGGACSGATATCTVSMSQAQSVTATFALATASSVSPYDGIYQWDAGYYLSVHQIGGGVLIGTIYWVYNANPEQVGTRSVPEADTFDLSHGQLIGSSATMTGTRFYRGCTLSYDFTFNPDASLSVRLNSVSNSPGVSVADVDCAARYTPVGSVRTIPRIY